MASAGEQRPLTDRLENVLQGFIPGLATMEDPARPVAVGQGRDAIIIDMPAATSPAEENRNGAGSPSEGASAEGGDGDNGERPGGIPDGHLRALRPLMERTLPFVLILLLKILYDHRLGVLVLIGMGAAFFHFNSKIKEQIAQRDKRSLRSLLFMFLLLPVNVVLVYYVFADQQLPKCLIFLKPNFEKTDFWTLLWVIGITDYVIKYITMATKCLVTALPRVCLSFKRRGRLFLCIESISQFYRFLTPVPIWMAFLSEGTDSHWLFSYALVLLYLMVKACITYSKMFECFATVRNVLKDSQYGSRPSSEQIQVVGEACPICQDNFNNPVELHCKHIFCEECVTMWFDRERTCPMCRAKVADSPQWRDGSTTGIIQWF
ncbi:RING finger and transmembrane domain-containing protein 2-like [Acanthaster planci]|uniref:RING finger and transmembrane domain-containing protein 2-like n=1 Tax=Acanthaster planci TaxID=133434 RepID=A0A8B7YRA4_ACAPL|nr:RING finger and transmembrane domain-containing protein 2-like [Acanthaster planci]XP_022095815.1 RING finger and transmembrane domain-containing protein 2-like [Acanthaster planci]